MIKETIREKELSTPVEAITPQLKISNNVNNTSSEKN